MAGPERLRFVLILAAKVAGAVAVVVLIVVLRAFARSGQPSASSNLEAYVSGLRSPGGGGRVYRIVD